MKLHKPTKQLVITSCFLAFLFVMMAGLVLPVVLRRLGVMEAVPAYTTDVPDETVEPVNIRQTYPIAESAQTEAPATMYDRVKRVENTLRGLIGTIETFSNENVPARTDFIELYIKIQKALGSRVIDGDDVVIKMTNGSLTFLSDELTQEEADICADNLIGFAEYAKAQGAEFLYVQPPNKINKYDVKLPEGVEDYANANADGLIGALGDAGVPVLDLRDSIVEDLDFDKAFYDSDHHWTPDTGLWAAGRILEELNDRYDAGFDLTKTDRANYEEEVHESMFLGALGKKTGLGYVPLDDMSVLSPAYETDFTMEVVARGHIYKGDFIRAFIDETQLEIGDYYTKNPYAAYFRDDQALVHVTNHKAPEGKKVLLLKDSFGISTAPFMATAIRELDVIDLRHFNGSLEAYVAETQPDIVVVMYNPKAITAPAGYHADLFDFQ